MEAAPNRIRELRIAQHLSQEALGERIGVHKMTISDLERGRIELTLSYMRRLAAALSVPISDLLTSADHPERMSAEEASLLQAFRQSNPAAREFLLASAKAVSGSSDERSVA